MPFKMIVKKDVPAEKSDADIPQDEESRFAAIATTYHVMILAGLVRKENGKLYNSTVFWEEMARY